MLVTRWNASLPRQNTQLGRGGTRPYHIQWNASLPLTRLGYKLKLRRMASAKDTTAAVEVSDMERKFVSARSLISSNPSLLMLVGELRSTLKGCRTVLDIGCGNASPLRFIPELRLTGLDGYAPALEEAWRMRTHDEFVSGSVLKIGELFGDRRFDACVALDVVEHLQKDDGWRMLEQMERLATKRVVIFTPNGFIPQKSE